METAISNQAEKLEARIGERKAVNWYKVATGERTPFKEACDRFKEDAGKGLSISTLNNLETAIREFMEFAGMRSFPGEGGTDSRNAGLGLLAGTVGRPDLRKVSVTKF